MEVESHPVQYWSFWSVVVEDGQTLFTEPWLEFTPEPLHMICRWPDKMSNPSSSALLFAVSRLSSDCHIYVSMKFRYVKKLHSTHFRRMLECLQKGRRSLLSCQAQHCNLQQHPFKDPSVVAHNIWKTAKQRKRQIEFHKTTDWIQNLHQRQTDLIHTGYWTDPLSTNPSGFQILNMHQVSSHNYRSHVS